MLMSIKKEDIAKFISEEKDAFLKDFKKIVESPSVSSQQHHKKDILETAKIAAELIHQAGGEATIIETKGNPVVFGRIENDPKAPTVAIYNHLDVQPAEEGKDGWTRKPFVFTEEKGRYYSRGTTDDKGPALTTLWAAKIAKKLGVKTNVEFIWELEEEIGSPNFAEFCEKSKSKLKADSIVVSDTIWIAPGKPATSLGLRGMLGTLVRLRTGNKDVHSGLAGGAARNPLTELSALIASCIDAKTGDIKIPGFDQTWTKPSETELTGYVNSGFSAEDFKSAHKLHSLRYDTAKDVTARIWGSPTFEVHGIVGGYQGEGVKTIVPPFAEAKISFRLVPPQDPHEIFELFKKHVKAQNPDCEVILEGILEPYTSPQNHKLNDVIKEAATFGFGKAPVGVREGGSIGAVVTMDKLWKKPIMFMGLSLPEDSYHGPDESFAWEQVEGGVYAFVKYYELLNK